MPCLAIAALLVSAALQRDRLLVYLDDQGQAQPVTTPAEWALRRQAILAGMQEAMGPHPGNDKRVPLDVQVTEEVALDQVVRRRLSFAVEAGDRVPAFLFLPKSAGKHAAVLCLHQTIQIGKGEPAGLGGSANLHYALELAERGFVTLAPDYPNFGDYQVDAYALGYASATMKGIWNHQRALDLLQSLPEVDPERIGCIGHSLGGHNTLYLAAFDERVKIAVTSCGFNAFSKYMGGDLTGWSHKGYMPRIAERYHCRPAEMPFDFPEILAAIAPRRIFINAPLHDSNFEVSGVDDCITAARPVFALLGAEDHLTVIHPDCEHDFPPSAREAAYQAIADALR
ncbi:MAG: alpha/beta fold hydrolase [Armatimonadetes bacterium]|nr:alpha/beta fold hydrolase [Armatimonadota bacterium]